MDTHSRIQELANNSVIEIHDINVTRKFPNLQYLYEVIMRIPQILATPLQDTTPVQIVPACTDSLELVTR